MIQPPHAKASGFARFGLQRNAGSLRAQPLLTAVAASALMCAATPAMATAVASSYVDAGGTNPGRYEHDTARGMIQQVGSASGSVGIGGTVSTSLANGDYAYCCLGLADAASATANINTGSLHIQTDTGLVNGNGSSAGASARLQDAVKFHGPGPAGTAFDLMIDLHFQGSISDLAHFSYYYYFDFSKNTGPGPYVAANLGWDARYLDSSNPFNSFGWANHGGWGAPAGWKSWQLTSDTVNDFHFRGTVELFTDAEYQIDEFLRMDSSYGTDLDFSHSAHLAFEMPSGISFTSESGKLLTDVGGGTSVPEPASWALALFGLGALRWSPKRARARSVAQHIG